MVSEIPCYIIKRVARACPKTLLEYFLTLRFILALTALSLTYYKLVP